MFPQKTGGAPNTFNGGERKFDLGVFIQNFWMPKILEAVGTSNFELYYTLVDELDVNLDPFHDDIYKRDLKALKEIREKQLKAAGKDEIQHKAIERRFYRTWRRLLMNLMARENMMRQEDGVLDET